MMIEMSASALDRVISNMQRACISSKSGRQRA
jgi:hypothetical protein